MSNNKEIKQLLLKDFKKGIKLIETKLAVDSQHRNSFYLLKKCPLLLNHFI